MSDLLTALGRSTFQGAIVIGIVWLICRAFERRLPASVRCTLWRLCHIKLLLGLVITGGIALPLLRVTPRSDASPTASTPAVSAERRVALATVKANDLTPTVGTVKGANPKNERRPDWLFVATLAYIAGLATCLSRLSLAWMRARRLLRAAAPVTDNSYLTNLTELSTKLDLRPTPLLATSDEITGPTYVSGAILLPTGCVYEPDALRLILAHELAHARRRDLVYEWLGVLTQTLFYFHPLVHLARREERLARESAADALALRITGAPAATFGALLLEHALNRRPGLQLAGAIGVLEGRTLLHRRLSALKGTTTMSANHKLVLLPLAALLALIPWHLTYATDQTQAMLPNIDMLGSSSAFTKMPRGDHSITGQIRDDGGNPAGDVVAGFFLMRNGEHLDDDSKGMPPSPTAYIHVGASGRYLLTGLPAGHFGILVLDYAATRMERGLRHRPSIMGRFAPTPSELIIRPEEKTKVVNLMASRGVTISGRVLDRASGRPIENVSVVSDQEQPNGITQESGDTSKTGADGRYFLRILPGRVSAVVVSVGGVRTRTDGEKFNLSIGQNVTYDFRITVPSR